MSNPWSAFYWGDYIADTGHLTLAQHGAYLLLMAHYYRTRRPLPANASVLHRICRCTTDADKSAVDEVLTEFFTSGEGLYRHNRIDRELAKSTDISEKRRVAAQAKHQKGRDANAVQMHTQPQPQSQPQAPSQSKTDPPLLENGFVHSKEKSRSQTDFDERDSRELAKAKKTILSRLRAIEGVGTVSEDEFMTAVCEESGLLPDRVRELEQKSKWVGASA